MEEAISDCNLSLDLQSDDADTRDSRAFVYLKTSMLEEAIGDYAIALGLNPNLAASLYGHGAGASDPGLKAKVFSRDPGLLFTKGREALCCFNAPLDRASHGSYC
jgi:hypothetical protein